MAHKKAGGSTSYGRDSHGQRLGIKLYAGERVRPGLIIVRQRGTKVRPGINVAIGKDDTLFSMATGIITFTEKKIRRFTGAFKTVKFVNVVAAESTQQLPQSS